MQSLQNQGIVHTFHAKQALLAGFRFAGFLTGHGGDIGLQHVLRPHKAGDVVAYLKTCGVGIRQQNHALGGGNAFEERLHGFILKDSKTICCQDGGIHKVGQAGGIVFAFHHKGLGQVHFILVHARLLASESSQMAFCISSGASRRLPFKSRSSFCRMRRLSSIWLR